MLGSFGTVFDDCAGKRAATVQPPATPMAPPKNQVDLPKRPGTRSVTAHPEFQRSTTDWVSFIEDLTPIPEISLCSWEHASLLLIRNQEHQRTEDVIHPSTGDQSPEPQSHSLGTQT